MAWDDRRQTFRMQHAENRLSVPQHYFRVALAVLGAGAAVTLSMFAVLAFYAITGR